MSNTNVIPKASEAWKFFTMASFAIAAGMQAGGICFLEASFAAKGFCNVRHHAGTHCNLNYENAT